MLYSLKNYCEHGFVKIQKLGALKMSPVVGCSKYDLADEQHKDPEVKFMLDYLQANVLPENQPTV